MPLVGGGVGGGVLGLEPFPGGVEGKGEGRVGGWGLGLGLGFGFGGGGVEGGGGCSLDSPPV